MMKINFFIAVSIALCGCFIAPVSLAQTVSQKLQSSFQQFENDSQLKHAISSLYVIDAKTGKVIFDKNSQIGLAPASTQKIITAATAFELLGKDYRYSTDLAYSGKVNNGVLNGNLYVIGTGDPSLGSWRWEQTKDSFIFKNWIDAVKQLRVKKIEGALVTNLARFSYQAIPDGWIWQDIGNYYGAGSYAINWKENQYDLTLKSDNKIGGQVEVFKNTVPANFINNLRSAGKGSGDNAYIYYDNSISGTIPVNEKNFTISGSLQDPISDMLSDFSFALMKDSIQFNSQSGGYNRNTFIEDSSALKGLKKIYTHNSPTLDSIIYWFLQKSINLYGEALIKTFAYEKKGFGSSDSGVAIVKDFWKQKGIDEDELNISDGSGLSPQNRVTTHVQVGILKYAKNQSWFPYFYAALPEFNNMKMKSGTIKNVKGYTGYHTSKSGNEYIFSFLVNNYNGSSSALVNKMYKVLNNLK